MDSITVQYLIAAVSIALGLGLLLSVKDNIKFARMLGAMFIALGVLVGTGTMTFGDLELF